MVSSIAGSKFTIFSSRKFFCPGSPSRISFECFFLCQYKCFSKGVQLTNPGKYLVVVFDFQGIHILNSWSKFTRISSPPLKMGIGIYVKFPGCMLYPRRVSQLSNEKNPGWLGYIGDHTTQLYYSRDYNKPF